MAYFPRLSLPKTPHFQRPPDLLYANDERPPLIALAALGLQHMATALALITYVLASAQVGNLDQDTTRHLVTATIIGMALATFFQAWGGSIGAGLLVVHIPDPLLLLIVGLVVAEYGLGGLVAVGVVNGLVALFAGYLMPFLRSVLPPTVAGVVVCLAGLSLITPGLQQITGMDAQGQVNGAEALVGAITLAVIVVLSIWGNRRSKLFALLAGLVAGIAAAAWLGQLENLAALAHAPVFQLPVLPRPNLAVDPAVLIAIAVLAMMTQLDVFGSVVLMHKMNDADWRRPNMRMVGAGMRANGLGNLLAAWLGSYPSATSSANIALAHISRSTSRWIGLLTGGLLLLAAFMPQLTLSLTLIPRAVVGAVGLYAAAYLIVSGIELIASRALDARGIFMIGLSFVAGVGMMFQPRLAELAPESLRFVAQNGVILAGMTAIVLNLLFRLGTSRHASLTLEGTEHTPLTRQIIDFIETQGGVWSARRDVVRRAAQAALEAAEAIQAAGDKRRLVEIKGTFDEYNLDIELVHTGAPLPLQAAEPSFTADLLDLDNEAFEAALDQTMAEVSHVMLKRLADKLKSGPQPKGAFLLLHFAH